MRQILPSPAEVDLLTTYGEDDRRPPEGRPWVLLNMIQSVDGATAIDGRSGGLGGPADKEVFSAIRSVADVIMVGAHTARVERYGPARLSDAARSARLARGQDPVPRIAVVSASLQLDPSSPVFAGAESRSVVITTETAPRGALSRLSTVSDIIVAGTGPVDVESAVRQLAGLGARIVLCEGGPTMNGYLVAAGLVDEVCATIAPTLVGSTSPRMVQGAIAALKTPLHLDRVLESDGMLFVRYTVTGPRGASEPSPS